MNQNKSSGGDCMLSAKEVAQYYLSKNQRKIFNKNIIEYNNRKSYEGNIRLNKYLFLAQVVYLAKYNKRLFEDDFLAYDNGPVVKDIVENYGIINNKNNEVDILPNIKDFLDKIYLSLENATYEELIEITHEDPEWIRLSKDTYNAPVMKIEDNIEEYKKRYKGLIEALKL